MLNRKYINFLKYYSTALICLGLFIFALFVLPIFRSLPNIIDLFRHQTILFIISLGLTHVIISGSIDLSIGSVAGVAGVTTAVFLSSAGPFFAPLIGLMAGVSIGLFNGVIVTLLGVSSLIATVGSMFIGQGMELVISGGFPIKIDLLDDKVFLALAHTDFWNIIPATILVTIIAGAISFIISNYTILGRKMHAVGDSVLSAKYAAINSDKIIRIAFVFSSLLAGIGGILIVMRVTYAQPLASQKYLLDSMAAVYIGQTLGKRRVPNVAGTFVGTFILVLIENLTILFGISFVWLYIFKGVILIISVAASGAGMREDIRKSY